MIACRKLFAALVRRGYSERFLRKIKDKTLCELRKNPNKGSSQRCTTRNCKLCSTQVVVESGKTMEGVLDAGNQIPTTQNCDSTNGIYCIVCSKCKKLYVGETGLSFRKRINIHRSDVRLKKDTAVATHFNSGSCRATHLRVLYLEVLKNTGDITLNKIGRLEAEKKWQLALKTYSPFGLNTVPSPKDSGVTPFVITYSATAVETAKLVKTSFNKLEAKHPNILYKRCVTAFKRGQNLRDLLVRSRLGKAPLDNPTVTRFDSSQDLTTLVNALDEV